MGEISEPHDRHRGAFSVSWQPVIDGGKSLWRGWRFLIGSSLRRRAGEGMEKEKKHGQRQPDLSTSLALTNACAVCFCFLFPPHEGETDNLAERMVGCNKTSGASASRILWVSVGGSVGGVLQRDSKPSDINGPFYIYHPSAVEEEREGEKRSH